MCVLTSLSYDVVTDGQIALEIYKDQHDEDIQYKCELGKCKNSIDHQMARWLHFLEQWEHALSTGLEVHVVGDVNINHCNWMDPSLPPSNQTFKL